MDVSVGWNQSQGSALHAGTAETAPAPPFSQAWQATVPLGGPNNQWGLSAPAVAGDTLVTVGPKQVMGFKLEDGSASFTVDRTLGPPVTAAVTTVGKVTAVVYTEGFGTESESALPPSPGATTSPTTATPTSSVSPTGTGSPAASGSATPSGSPGGSPAPVSTTSQLAAFDLQTRKPLWPPVTLDQASRSGVAVQDGVAYVGDDTGVLYAIDLAKGTVEWRQTVGGTPLAPPAVVGDLVVVSVPGNTQIHPALVGLKVADGSQAWRYEGTLGIGISGLAASPAGDAVYAVFPDNTLRAVGLDGTLKWSERLNAAVGPFGSPAVTDDAVYTLDGFGQLTRFDRVTGHQVWDFAINEPVNRGAPVVAGDHVLAATGRGRLVAVDPATGHLVWQSDAPGGLLRGLTPTSDLIVAVRGGTDAGLVAFGHDDNGALVDVASPTVFNAGTFASGFAIAALGFVAVMVLLGRFLSGRLGPAFIVEGDDEDEPVDPWGDEET